MATLTTTTTTPTATATQPPGLALDFLPYIDMTTLSQSELRALSLCSTSSSSSDVIIPTIDHSLFNESAGSRRQTYSRPSHHHHHHRHRLAALLPKTPSPSPPSSSSNDPSTDPDRLQNHSIITFLKQLLSSHPQFQQSDFLEFDSFSHFHHPIYATSLPPPPVPPQQQGNFVVAAVEGRKRKRGRKPKVKVMSAEERERAMGLEIVNKNGVVVDLVWLASLEDPYKEELKRRTEGMEKEEELLGFFRDLGGEWCSRRKKRKIVDASEFGDTLPVGWKLLLGLKRKEGRAWVYCRRYISPGGQQLVSCKEVSAYLQSFFGPCDAHQAKDYAGDIIQQNNGVASEGHVGAIEKEEDQMQSLEHYKEVNLLGIDNLAEVQIRDLFECHKCKMTFDEKDTYLQHLLSFHQRTTRRYRLGSSVGDGVIVKDGKYECQFCHKVFHERRRYNGHVGIHVRNYVRGVEESPVAQMALQTRNDSLAKDDLPARISKMDALIEIAQNSIRETSSSGPTDETNGGLTSDKQNVAFSTELPASVSDREPNSDSPLSEPEFEDGMTCKSVEPELRQQKGNCIEIDENMGKIEDASYVLDVKMDFSSSGVQYSNMSKTLGGGDGVALSIDEIDKPVIECKRGSENNSLSPLSNPKVSGNENHVNLVGTDRPDHPKPDEVDKRTNTEIKIGFGNNNSLVDHDIIQETVEQSFKENVLQHGVPEPPMLQLQPLHDLSAPNAILDKGENEFGTTDQRHDKVTGFEELRLEEIEQLKFSFGAGQEPISLPEVPLNLGNNTEMEGAYGASVQFESEAIVDLASRQQLTTVCVWCGVEFSHEAIETEIQSDSVGYMCPACKAKISGQLNVFE